MSRRERGHPGSCPRACAAGPAVSVGGGRGGPHSPGDRDPGDGDRLCCSRARLAVNGRKGCAVQPRAQLERLSDTGLSPLDAQRIRRGSGRHAALANFGVRGRGRKAGGGLPGHPRSKPAVWARARAHVPWSRDGASAGPTSALGRGPGGRSGAPCRAGGRSPAGSVET